MAILNKKHDIVSTKNIICASFISDPLETTENVPVFRKEFEIDDRKSVKAAVLDITCMGCYEAHINGKRVGEFRFAPGFTSYNHRIQFQSYDVSDLIVEGVNTIEVIVGNGWFFGGVGHNSFDEGKHRSLISSLCLKSEDGSERFVRTDKSWSVAKSPILYSDIYNGETYDSRVIPSDWHDVAIDEFGKSVIVPNEGEEVKEIETVGAVSLIITPNGERVIDFGQNLTGYVCFRTVGKSGDEIIIDHAEVLDRFGNFYTDNLRSAKQRVKYICNGDDTWYHPVFSFQGFRYIRLVSFPEEVYIGDFYAIVVHSDMRRTGYFECSEPLVNKLYNNVIWGQKGNYLDIPTDCPQRDEREGWTGDANVFCRAAIYNYDVERFYTKWLHDLALDQKSDGAVTSLVPMAWDITGAGCFAWGDAATSCPWELYVAYGNKQILRDQYDSMKSWVRYVSNKGNTPAEWASGPQFGDWLAMDSGEGANVGATPFDFLATAFLAYSAEIVVKSGREIGEDVSEFEQIAKKAKDAFNSEFILPDGKTVCDTQTSYCVALAFDLVDDKKKCAAHLAEKVKQNGNKIQTGFIGTAYIMDALSSNGYADVAYSLLLQREFPSWLYSVRKGATTIWEHWDGIKPDGTMWSDTMNSFNHYSYGAVAAWMYGTIAGIKPDETNPGYKNIIISPIPDARMSYAKASLLTRHGVVKSEWVKKDDGFDYRITVPMGTTADITIGGSSYKVDGGEYCFHSK